MNNENINNIVDETFYAVSSILRKMDAAEEFSYSNLQEVMDVISAKLKERLTEIS